jgi:hypothetical protein
MIPLVYNDITVATYQIIIDNENNNILGIRFIQIYGDSTDTNKSILILINLNNYHWTCALDNNNI